MPESIGPYTITREIGRGGMGVVYLARDTKLDRDVAIKALPAEFAEDAERLTRFEREARTLAALNHPHIAQIYGLEEVDGQRYLILEYVPGETLNEVIQKDALPVSEALPIAKQIAEAIESAHEQGIIHRDLKPANIKFADADTVKVLDFGLAKAFEGAFSSPSGDMIASPTYIPSTSPTMQGAVLGTAGYLSPEQARGRHVDKRSDMFSFGCVFYEMLAGATVFGGETVTDSLGATLHREPDWDALPSDTPPTIRLLLRRCLTKDRKRRLQDIGDARVEIEEAISDPTSSSLNLAASAMMAAGATSAKANRLKIAGALFVGVVITAIGAWFLRPADAPRALQKYDLITHIKGEPNNEDPCISPGGNRLAYVRDGVVHVRDFPSFESRALTNTENASNVFWSPDGGWIGYSSGGSLHKVALVGGGAVKIADVAGDGGGWTLDGRIIVSNGDELLTTPARGGEPTLFRTGDHEEFIDYHEAGVIVGTNLMVYMEHRGALGMAIVVDDGDKRVAVVELEDFPTGVPAYSPTGHILFTRNMGQDLWAIGFDLDTMEVTGEQFLVMPNAGEPSTSLDGTLVVRRGGSGEGGTLAWVGPSENAVSIEVETSPMQAAPLVSPDGDRIAFVRGNNNKMDVWIHNVDRGTTSRITFLEGLLFPRAWSPDGSEIAIIHFIPGADSMLTTRFFASDGSGESRDAIELGVSTFDREWKKMVGFRTGRGSESSVFEVSLDDPTDKNEITTLAESANLFDRGVISPDWSIAAFTDSGSGQSEVFCTRYPEGTGRWQISTDGGNGPIWSSDGETLFFESENAIFAVDVTREPALEFGMPREIINGDELGVDLSKGWSPAPVGEQFITVLKPAQEGPPVVISVIHNWYEEFRKQ